MRPRVRYVVDPRGSIRVKVGAQFIWREIPARLPEDGMARPGIELTMIGNRQRLLFPSQREPSHFDVAAPLREDEKPELLKNGDDVGCRKSPQFRHTPVPLPS
jgi:hypothetical protein